MVVVVPWPPSALSGHNTGGWYSSYPLVKKHRRWARNAALEAKARAPSSEGDIPLSILFVPPNRRGDRTNYPNRLKPALDGLADALGVNDRRFLPTYHYAEPEKARPRVEITIGGPAL